MPDTRVLRRDGEGVGHDPTGDSAVGGQVQQVAGVVVEPADDLDLDPGAEQHVGEVGLPELVGAVRDEPDATMTGGVSAVAGSPDLRR